MRAMNTILSDIVIASGGVVEKPNNRNSLLQDWLDAVMQPIIQRYFIKLDPVLNSYYQLNTPFVATGSFIAAFDVFTTVSSGSPSILSGDTSITGSPLVYINGTSGALLLRIPTGAGYVYTASTTKVNDGALHSCALVFDSATNTYSLNVNEIEEASVAQAGVDNTLLYICRGVEFFNGIIANPAFIDLSNPANNQTYKLDQATGNTETSIEGNHTLTYNNIPESNRELFTLTDEGWLGQEINSRGVITFTGDEGDWSGSPINTDISPINGAMYQLTVTNNILSGQARFTGVNDMYWYNFTLPYVSKKVYGTDYYRFSVQTNSGDNKFIGTSDISLKRLIEVA